jgi:hypothetical protein
LKADICTGFCALKTKKNKFFCTFRDKPVQLDSNAALDKFLLYVTNY